MTIRTKLFLAFTGISAVPFLVVTPLLLYLNGREMERSFADTASRSARQAALSLDALIEPANRAVGMLASGRAVAELAVKDSRGYENNLGEWYLDSLEIRTLMRTASSTTPMIDGLVVVMRDGLAGFSESIDFHLLPRGEPEKWMRTMDDRKVDLYWFPPEDFPEDTRRAALSGVARIRDPENWPDTVGFARADVPIGAFRAVLENAELSENAFAFIADDAGRIVTISARGTAPDPGALAALCESVASEAATEIEFERDFGGGRLLVVARRLVAPGWRFTLAVPHRDVVRSADRARGRTLLVFLLIVPLLFPAAWLLARSSTRRIRSLRDRLALVGSGHPATRADDGSDDEIGQLSRRFNEMTLRIESLLKEEYELGRRVNTLELRVLQAQIDPHFLYNTLDMVNCLALARGATEISEAVAALARFYRASLAGGADTVELSAELDHVRRYVELENLRFEGGIRLEIEVPAELASIRLPKMTLQPLVENAIHHGILETEDQRGTVFIRCARSDGMVNLEVADDGVGLGGFASKDAFSSREEDRGFGLKNIRDRLTLTFGEGAELRLSQTPDGGCAATIRFPFDQSFTDK